VWKVTLIALLATASLAQAQAVRLQCHWKEAEYAVAQRPLPKVAADAAVMFNDLNSVILEVDPNTNGWRIVDSGRFGDIAAMVFGPGGAVTLPSEIRIEFTQTKFPGISRLVHKVVISIDRFNLSSGLMFLFDEGPTGFRSVVIRHGQCSRPLL
jgi:uncharacterized membrane protein